MSVHTNVSTTELTSFLANYQLGELVGHTGIAEGITNTIYKVQTTQGDYILTLFETLGHDELPFFIEVQSYLAEQGLAIPKIFTSEQGVIRSLCNKPAILSEFMPGETIAKPTLQQAQVIGVALAKLHQATEKFSATRTNPFTVSWHQALTKQVLPHVGCDEQELLVYEMAYQAKQDYNELPSGIIHMDLFPDNVLFQGEQLMALLDFYYACHDRYLYDLAVAMNAWSLSEGGLRNTIGEALLVAYQRQRPLQKVELQQLKNMRRYAALHFYLTRLRDRYLQPEVSGVLVKPPQEFYALLASLQ